MTTVIEKPAKANRVSVAPKPLTLGQASDAVWTLREEKRVLDAAVKVIEKKIEALTEQIFGLLDEQDTRKAEGKKASVSINVSVQATTVDWTEFMQFIAKGKRNDKDAYLHLVQKRVSVEAYRELLELGVVVPGLTPFNKRTLSITSL